VRAGPFQKHLRFSAGVCIQYIKNTPPGGGVISRCHLRKKYEKRKRKRGNLEKEGMGKKNEERERKRERGK
jgi:hypothetical protein